MNRGNTTKERMKKVLTALEVSADEFENKCGLPSGFVDDINREIPKKIRQKIIRIKIINQKNKKSKY